MKRILSAACVLAAGLVSLPAAAQQVSTAGYVNFLGMTAAGPGPESFRIRMQYHHEFWGNLPPGPFCGPGSVDWAYVDRNDINFQFLVDFIIRLYAADKLTRFVVWTTPIQVGPNLLCKINYVTVGQ